MKNSIYHLSLKRILFFTNLIFAVLPLNASILKFKCEGNFGYDVSYKLNYRNESLKKSRPIFTENKTPKSFIVSYDLKTGNGSIDGKQYSYEIEKTKWNSLIFKSISSINDIADYGSTSKSTSELEDFSFIIDDFENLNRYKVSNIKGSRYFTAQKRRVLENLKYTLEEDYSFKNYEREIKTNYEFISGLCK